MDPFRSPDPSSAKKHEIEFVRARKTFGKPGSFWFRAGDVLPVHSILLTEKKVFVSVSPTVVVTVSASLVALDSDDLLRPLDEHPVWLELLEEAKHEEQKVQLAGSLTQKRHEDDHARKMGLKNTQEEEKKTEVDGDKTPNEGIDVPIEGEGQPPPPSDIVHSSSSAHPPEQKPEKRNVAEDVYEADIIPLSDDVLLEKALFDPSELESMIARREIFLSDETRVLQKTYHLVISGVALRKISALYDAILNIDERITSSPLPSYLKSFRDIAEDSSNVTFLDDHLCKEIQSSCDFFRSQLLAIHEDCEFYVGPVLSLRSHLMRTLNIDSEGDENFEHFLPVFSLSKCLEECIVSRVLFLNKIQAAAMVNNPMLTARMFDEFESVMWNKFSKFFKDSIELQKAASLFLDQE